MGYDIEKTLTAYKILVLVKGFITYVIPILTFIIFCLMHNKLENIEYELKKIRQVIEKENE